MTTEAPVFLLAPPQRDEADYLTRLCLRSKQHWGYDEKFMASTGDASSGLPFCPYHTGRRASGSD